jgi:hypothetical protein
MDMFLQCALIITKTFIALKEITQKQDLLTMDSIYNSTQHLKEALKAYGMKNNCPYVVVNSSKTRFGAKCKNVDCPMQLTAYKHQDGFVHVKVCHLQHSPYCMETKTATTSAIKSACRSLVSIQLEPKEVVNYIEYTHGATTTYHTAWKALNESGNEKQLVGRR